MEAKSTAKLCLVARLLPSNAPAGLRSKTAIDSLDVNPACRLRRPCGVNIKRHGFAVIMP